MTENGTVFLQRWQWDLLVAGIIPAYGDDDGSLAHARMRDTRLEIERQLALDDSNLDQIANETRIGDVDLLLDMLTALQRSAAGQSADWKALTAVYVRAFKRGVAWERGRTGLASVPLP